MRAIPQQDKTISQGNRERNRHFASHRTVLHRCICVTMANVYAASEDYFFGNAGAHRQALDDIATISTRLKEVGQRYGNPSGTAQTRNIFTLAGGLMFAPGATIPAALGGAVGAYPCFSCGSVKRRAMDEVIRGSCESSFQPNNCRLHDCVTQSGQHRAICWRYQRERDVLRAIQGPMQMVAPKRTNQNPNG